MIKLKCEICGVNYEKPAHYKKWNNVFFKWSLRFCDDCRRKKENEALKRLPELIKAKQMKNNDSAMSSGGFGTTHFQNDNK